MVFVCPDIIGINRESTTTPRRGGLHGDPKRVHEKNNTHRGDAKNAEFTI